MRTLNDKFAGDKKTSRPLPTNDRKSTLTFQKERRTAHRDNCGEDDSFKLVKYMERTDKELDSFSTILSFGLTFLLQTVVKLHKLRLCQRLTKSASTASPKI